MTQLFPPSPAHLGGYRLVRELGRGTSAVVWEGEHVALGKRVAIKVLHADRAAKGILAARFVREGRAVARVRHPHVVDVLDVGEHQGAPYLVMELVEGATLATIFAEAPAMTLPRLLDLMLPVLAAVQAAHDCGVLHRDLKPANILIGRDRHGDVHPKVADFGISKLISDPASHAVTEDGALVGTLAYMAPEQVRSSRAVDARADQYALAVVLYQGATGVLPYASDTTFGLLEAIARGELRSPRELRPDLPAGFSDALLRALCMDRDARFGSVRALAKALLPFASARAWSAFARDFEEPARAPIAVDGGTCDETPRGVETGHPIAVDVPAARGAGRAMRGGILAAVACVVVAALAVGPRIFARPAVNVAPSERLEASAAQPVAAEHAEPHVTIDAPAPVQSARATASAATRVDETPPLADVTPPRAPLRSAPAAPPKRANAVVRTGAASGQESAARKGANDAVPAASSSPAPKARYELGDHDAPIVE